MSAGNEAQEKEDAYWDQVKSLRNRYLNASGAFKIAQALMDRAEEGEHEARRTFNSARSDLTAAILVAEGENPPMRSRKKKKTRKRLRKRKWRPRDDEEEEEEEDELDSLLEVL